MNFKAVFRFSSYLFLLIILLNFSVAFLPISSVWKTLLSFLVIVVGVWGVVGLERHFKPKYGHIRRPSVANILRRLGWTKPLTPPVLPEHFLMSRAQEHLALTPFASRVLGGELQHFSFGEYQYASTNRGLQSVTLFVWQILFPQKISGWVRIRPSTSFFATFMPDKKLESNLFNREVELYGSDASLPYLVFHPDTMAWYLELKHRPWIHIEGNQCIMVAEGDLSEDQFFILDRALLRLIAVVKKSGALQE